MARINVIVLAAVFALGIFAAGVYASEEMAKGMNRPYGMSELLGSSEWKFTRKDLNRLISKVNTKWTDVAPLAA